MQISDELSTIVAYAKEEAMRTGSYAITPDHLFLGILRHSSNPACDILVSRSANPSELKLQVESSIFRDRSIPYNDEEKVRLNRESSNVLSRALFEAGRTGSPSADSRHLLMALSRCETCRCRIVLESAGISFEELSSEISKPADPESKKQEAKASARILGTFSIKAPEIYS